VRGPVDHEGWSKSICFEDPNGLQLEVCHLLRAFVAEDAIPRGLTEGFDTHDPKEAKALLEDLE
jgi:hypothetical protein